MRVEFEIEIRILKFHSNIELDTSSICEFLFLTRIKLVYRARCELDMRDEFEIEIRILEFHSNIELDTSSICEFLFLSRIQLVYRARYELDMRVFISISNPTRISSCVTWVRDYTEKILPSSSDCVGYRRFPWGGHRSPTWRRQGNVIRLSNVITRQRNGPFST
jgi:hypothetical protein